MDPELLHITRQRHPAAFSLIGEQEAAFAVGKSSCLRDVWFRFHFFFIYPHSHGLNPKVIRKISKSDTI